MTFLPSGPADSAALSRLFLRLQSSNAYAIIIIQTSEGPQDFALLPTLVHNKQHLIAVTPPALVDGDPCQQCPGWFRFSFRHWASPVENDDACWAHLDYASDASD